MARNNLGRMMLLMTIVWGLIIGESSFLFFVIRPTGPNIHESITSATLKISASIALAVVWVVVLFALENVLFHQKRKEPGKIGEIPLENPSG